MFASNANVWRDLGGTNLNQFQVRQRALQVHADCLSRSSSMDAAVGIAGRCIPSVAACGPVAWNWKKNGTKNQARRVLLVPSATSEDGANNGDGLKMQEQLPPLNKWTITSRDDVTKFFNITQQNLLQLNKQRFMALEELQKVQRDNDLLRARVSQLEAEYQVTAGECDMLQKKLGKATGVRWTSGSEGVSKSGEERAPLHSGTIWSELLLRIDVLAMTGALTLGQASALRELVRKRDAQAADVYVNLRDKGDGELSSGLVALLAPTRRSGLHVVFICTEMAPIAQAGSLATSISRLCQALRKRGHLVEVILPKYSSLDLSHVENLLEMKADLFSYFGGDWHGNKIWTGTLDSIAVTLIDPKHPQKFFERERIYDYEDDFERFTYFCRASLEYILKSGKQPNVLHLHNWQTAAVAPLFWDIYVNQGLQNSRILFTCHDLKYQCLQEPHKLSLCGLNSDQLHQADRLQDNFETGLVNLLKGGIVYSNKVTTVSPVYAHDIHLQEYGHGLDRTLNQHRQKFAGILNGIDESIWNPMVDCLIPSTYSVGNLSGKGVCKSQLLKSLRFPDPDKLKLLVGCIAPSVTDQDVEPLKTALKTTLDKGAQFVFVGASKIPRIQVVLEDLQRENNDAHFAVRYDESLAHQVVAAADILICPCFLEPSGQWPLVAMAYGTVPVGREIYGVQGSIIDADDLHGGRQDATGFNFCSTQPSDMANALTRALDRRETDPQEWTKLIRNGMQSNHSWDGQCVEAYEAAYYSLCVS